MGKRHYPESTPLALAKIAVRAGPVGNSVRVTGIPGARYV
jgi:hypothetical protein